MRALVIGSTGLVGRHLVRRLLAEPAVSRVQLFQRRPTGVEVGGRRAEEELVDFELIHEWGERLKGDVLLSALGTTRRAAGSAEAQYRVDHDYQVEAARAAAANGVRALVLVSSVGADPGARTFYLRMKGEIEEAVAGLSFERIHLLRPGILDGERKEFRPAERAGIALARLFARLGAPARMRPVHADTVARFMVECALMDRAHTDIGEAAAGSGVAAPGDGEAAAGSERCTDDRDDAPRSRRPIVVRHGPDEILG